MAERGLEFKPDAADPKRVRLSYGLPEGVSRAEITYRSSGGVSGTRLVRRSEAEFAHLRTAVDGAYEGPWSSPHRLSPAEADRYIDRVRQEIARRDEEIRRRRESIDLTCPWCARPRSYIGVVGFITGQKGLLTQRPLRPEPGTAEPARLPLRSLRFHAVLRRRFPGPSATRADPGGRSLRRPRRLNCSPERWHSVFFPLGVVQPFMTFSAQLR